MTLGEEAHLREVGVCVFGAVKKVRVQIKGGGENENCWYIVGRTSRKGRRLLAYRPYFAIARKGMGVKLKDM